MTWNRGRQFGGSWWLLGNEVFEFGAFPGSPLLFDTLSI